MSSSIAVLRGEGAHLHWVILSTQHVYLIRIAFLTSTKTAAQLSSIFLCRLDISADIVKQPCSI